MITGEKRMKNNPKMFTKHGFEGIWRPEARKLDVYEVDQSGTQHWLRSKEFTNGRVAEEYFMGKVKNRPVLQFADTGDDDHLSDG